MSVDEIKDYQEAERQIEQDKIEQYAKDTAIIRQIKKQVPKKLFRQIVSEIHESDNWSNVRIVDTPTGKNQSLGKSRNNVWIDQYCEFEDCYSGHVYIELPDGKYLAWNYWC